MFRKLYSISVDVPEHLFFEKHDPFTLYKSNSHFSQRAIMKIDRKNIDEFKVSIISEGVYRYHGHIDMSTAQQVYISPKDLLIEKSENLLQDKYTKWKHLVNMSASEIEKFKNRQLALSKQNKKHHPGLTNNEASELGISSGIESAEWIIKMKNTNVEDWSPTMWKWCNKQISFISRMKGMDGDLKDEKGNPSRKLLSLKIWGHDPYKN